MMKLAILLLALSALASADSHRRYGSNKSVGGSIQFPTQKICASAGCPIGGGEGGVLFLGACQNYVTTGVSVHYTQAGRDYHFSWCYDGGQKYTWQEAQNYCTNLGSEWYGVSIQTAAENNFVTNIVETNLLPYLWTSGSRRYSKTYGSTSFAFKWIDGSNLSFYNWGQTGRRNVPQPDGEGEQCLAILNHFYERDTTTWHDIPCTEHKPIICERPAIGKGYYQG